MRSPCAFSLGLAFVALALLASTASAQSSDDDAATATAQEIHDTGREVIDHLPAVVQPTLNRVYDAVQGSVDDARNDSDDDPWRQD